MPPTFTWDNFEDIAIALTDKFPDRRLGPQVGDPGRGAYLSWLCYYSGVLEPAFVSKFMHNEIPRGTAGWVAVDEARGDSYPRMYVTRQDGDILVSRLPPRPEESNLAWEGTTPMTCPWRVVAIGATRRQVSESKLARSLNP